MRINLLRNFGLFILIGFILTNPAYGQEFQNAGFGVIPDSITTLQRSPEYEDESYVITNKEVDISFDDAEGSIVAVMDYHIRMKFFDDTDPEASLITIPYYFKDNLEQISQIEGITYVPSGREIKINERDIRTVNLNSRYNVKEFRIPSVTEGAVAEYRYTIKRRYIEELPPFYMSHEVPTMAARLTITYPSYLRYKTRVENYERKIANDFVYTDTSSVPKIFTIPQPAPITTERWMAYNIKPTKSAPFITTLNDYRAKIKFLMNEFGIPRQSLDTSWDVVVAKMRRKTNPLAVIRDNRLAWQKGDSLAKRMPSSSLETIQDSVFHYLNRKVNFTGANSPYSTVHDTTVLAGAPHDQAAINETLVAMLRGAGIEADPVLLSSRKSGKIDMEFPIFYQFNAQIVRSVINGNSYLMDASYPNSEPGLIPVEMYHSPGVLLQDTDYGWMDINPQKSQFAIDVDIDASLSSDGTLSGTFLAHESGYPKQQFRSQKENGISNVQIIERSLFDGYGNLRLDSIEVKNSNQYDEPIEISGRFEIPNYATSFSDGLEFSPMIVGRRRENPFDNAHRDLPVTLNAPEKLSFSYSISLPAGFQLNQGKGNNIIQFEGASFEESYDLSGETMNYEYMIDISDYRFTQDLFPRLFDLYARWSKLSKAQWLIQNQ